MFNVKLLHNLPATPEYRRIIIRNSFIGVAVGVLGVASFYIDPRALFVVFVAAAIYSLVVVARGETRWQLLRKEAKQNKQVLEAYANGLVSASQDKHDAK